MKWVKVMLYKLRGAYYLKRSNMALDACYVYANTDRTKLNKYMELARHYRILYHDMTINMEKIKYGDLA